MMNHFYARLLTVASLFGIMGVSVGAFGAHFLKSRIDTNETDILKTGVLYLFVHTLMILIVMMIARSDRDSRLLKSSGVFYAIGIVLFSGSLFIIATKSIIGLHLGYFGILTPIGGLCFIIGWLLLFFYSFSYRI